jgi:hypothetical protein
MAFRPVNVSSSPPQLSAPDEHIPSIPPADFALATHNEEGETKYWRIRAFDDLSERVRDTVCKGQTALRLSLRPQTLAAEEKD